MLPRLKAGLLPALSDIFQTKRGLYNPDVTAAENPRLARVREQLALYEHPLLVFDARAKGEAVEVIIRFQDASVPVHTYYFELHPRDLDHPQFEWTFQRQLYDCLHDYLIEMFTRTPQNRSERAFGRKDP